MLNYRAMHLQCPKKTRPAQPQRFNASKLSFGVPLSHSPTQTKMNQSDYFVT